MLRLYIMLAMSALNGAMVTIAAIKPGVDSAELWVVIMTILIIMAATIFGKQHKLGTY